MQAGGRDGRREAIRGCPRRPRGRRCASLLATAALLSGPPALADGPTARFDLPAEPFPQAVIDFYRQCGVQAIYAATPRVERLRTHAVEGVLESSVALERMLEGTGLTFVFDTPRSVLIRPGAGPVRRPPAAAGRESGPPLAAAAPSSGEARLREVDVTGSLIPGVQQAIAPLVYVKPRQLAEASYATVQDTLYQLPFVSLNGPREDLTVDNNGQYGAGIDLRGLGVGATLVLVNGHRQPLSGLTGGFVDVSTIPWSAVRRIEVLPDGASALYGSDAIAGVVNIIMRDHFQGAETRARYGMAEGGRRETMVSQVLGTRWAGGQAMLAYQFSDDTPLAAAERAYAANADKIPFGGANYDSYYSNPGNILDPATLQPAYGIPPGQNGTGLSPAKLSSHVNLQNQFAGYQLFPQERAHELYASVSERPGAAVELFAQGRFAHRDTLSRYLPDQRVLAVPPSNPYYVNPFPGMPYTLVAYSFAKDLGPVIFASSTQVYWGTLGARFGLGSSWRATLSESYGRQALGTDEYRTANQAALPGALADPNPATALNPFGDGPYTPAATLAAISGNFPMHSTTGLESTRLLADGSLFALPGGEAKLAVGVERRAESLAHDVGDLRNPAAPIVRQTYGRHIFSAFSQLDLPLIGSPWQSAQVPRLELSLAGRYEHYSDFGDTFNPTVRVGWLQSRAVKLRASWGRSFRAPTLDDLYDTSQNATALVVLPDPASTTGRSLVLVQQGSNPDLKQETANTWTAGVDLAPALLRGATVSLTYYSIDYRNRIEQPAAGQPFAVLQQQSEWQAVIERNPSRAQIEALCSRPDFFGSAAACLASSPAAVVDGRLANLASTSTTGVDFEAHRGLGTALGAFDFDLRGTYVFTFDQSVTGTSPAVRILDTAGNPIALRLRATARWSERGPQLPGLALEVGVNRTGAYRNPGSTLLPEIPSWTTVDLQALYRTGDRGWLGGTELLLNATNVLDSNPPFLDNMFGYDAYNVQPLGRVVSVTLRKRW